MMRQMKFLRKISLFSSRFVICFRERRKEKIYFQENFRGKCETDIREKSSSFCRVTSIDLITAASTAKWCSMGDFYWGRTSVCKTSLLLTPNRIFTRMMLKGNYYFEYSVTSKKCIFHGYKV
jgi:hypothetical protein